MLPLQVCLDIYQPLFLRCVHEGELEIVDITPATVLGLQHLAIVGDTHLSRRLGWSLDGKTDGGWIGWCRPDVELSVKEVRLFQPVDNLVCLGGNTGRVRLVTESLGNKIGTMEHPFCLSIVELLS